MHKKMKNATSKSSNKTKVIKTVHGSGAKSVYSIISKGISLYQQGDITTAKKVLNKAIKKKPDDTDALYTLGLIAKDQGKMEEAARYFEDVLAFDADNVHAHFFLGFVLLDLKQYDKAAESYRAVVSLSPDDVEAWYNLGFIATSLGEYEEAIKNYRKVIDLNENYTNAYYNVGCNHLALKQHDEAISWFEKTIALDHDYADAWFNLGFIATERKNFEKAIEYYQKVVAINPNYAAAHTNLGLNYHYQNRLEEALECFEKALSINPEFSDAYLNMGNTFRHQGDLDKAADCYQKSIDFKQSQVGLSNLCSLQKELCKYESAAELSEKLLAYEDLQKADIANIHDTYIQLSEWEKASSLIDRLRTAPFDPNSRDVLAGSFMEFCAITDLSLDEIADLHKEWGTLTEAQAVSFRHEERLEARRRKKKIRLGYVSPDFHEHSVGYLIKDIITSHNHDEFEVYCYGNFDPKSADGFTQEIVNSCVLFKYVRHLSDREVAEEIYNDEIDILIELAGHTAGHRLRSLAYKPAPIQMTYLGYPNTTGLTRVDYRITDQYADSEYGDHRYSEKLLRLTNCFLTFKGFTGVAPEPPRQKENVEIIFGCFNNIQKLTPQAVKLWAQILKEVPNSKIHLKAKQLNTPLVWNNIVKEFARHGIAGDRLECLGYTATREEHLNLYNSINIALDTFPYNGTVTTLEALWMNVPVLTLVGESHAQRVGYSILKNLDLETLIAVNHDDYVCRAVELARHPEKIRELKTRMRKNFLASSICNPKVLTRELELRLKALWTGYFQGECTDGLRIRMATDEERAADAIGAMSTLRMAMVKLEAGAYEKAVAMSESLIKTSGISSLAWYVMAVAYSKMGEEEKALEALETSLSIDNRNAGAQKLLRDLNLRARGLAKEAVSIIDNAEESGERHVGI